MTAATMRAAGIGRMANTPPNTGLSGAAADLARRLGGLASSLREPLSLGRTYSEALRNLEEVAQEASQADWDGYGAAGIQFGAVHNARKLLAALPSSFPPPEIGADPDGEVSLEWFFAPDWVFSISVGRTGTLTYAGRFGQKDRVRGVKEGAIDDIDSEILGHVDRLLSVCIR